MAAVRTFLSIVFSLVLALLGTPARAEVVQVAAAADLKFVLDELVEAYRKAYPRAEPVRVSYGSSGNFFAQIRSGAPYTLYLSADSRYPLELERAGLTLKGTRRDYAVGRLVIWVPKGSPIDIARLGPQALSDPRVRRVALANPEHAPYGAAALSLLDHYGLTAALKPKFVYGENIAITAQYAQTAADAGILALSIAKAPSFAALGGSYWLAPLGTHRALKQQLVILKEGPNTRRFWSFVLSAPARELFRKYGFVLPREP
ncbi:molybdate transport system substrate-binding protein [Deinococcus reticulitermitis]|uniref:Molybdate transport system substrate-binding protein n=1 Tax=Deinococcus reticulitermitis TaxID=856736 RepID=A0A1H6SNU2_9DEIO|nr:molybdate transport system substrate-binding protein [Deinococcus reticulitermitis]